MLPRAAQRGEVYRSGAERIGETALELPAYRATHSTRGLASRLRTTFPRLRSVAVAFDKDLLVGLLGGGSSTLEVFDGDLAKHVQCSDRTVRRWRKAHLKESKARRFSLLEIVEGEYDAGRQCYGKTSYRFTAPDYVDAVVREARASDLYQRDRRAAIEQAAEEHYADIPDAPPRRRSRRPRRAPAVLVEQAFVNAARSVEKGRRALQDLSEDSRAALLESSQGEKLRQTLWGFRRTSVRCWTISRKKISRKMLKAKRLTGGTGQFIRYPLRVRYPPRASRPSLAPRSWLRGRKSSAVRRARLAFKAARCSCDRLLLTNHRPAIAAPWKMRRPRRYAPKRAEVLYECRPNQH